MEKTASKLDWLKERKDFNKNPAARAATRLLEHEYAPHGDDLYPWILRELKRGNIALPHPYGQGWMKIVEMEMAAEKELARRQQLVDQGERNFPESWGDDSQKIDWNHIEDAPWNRLTDFRDDMSGRYRTVEKTPWESLHQGQRFGIQHTVQPEDAQGRELGEGVKRQYATLEPEDLKTWGSVLADRAKRRQGVDPMQMDALTLHNKMKNEWEPEYNDRQRADNGEVLHQFPDKWSIRRLQNAEEAEQEGEDMGNCLGGYGHMIERGKSHIFSLRDPHNRPHTSFEIRPRNEFKSIPRGTFEAAGFDPEYLNTHGSRLVDDVFYAISQLEAHPDYYQQAPVTSDKWNRVFEIAKQEMERYKNAEGWHGGELRQAFGKENSAPNAEYQQRLRDWFAQMPEEQQPTNLENTPYHPEATPSYWKNHPEWGGAWPEEELPRPPLPPDLENGIHPEDVNPEDRIAHTLHHPAPAHKNRVTGEICHCPWGEGHELWSWNEDEDPLYLGDGLRSRKGISSNLRSGVDSLWNLSSSPTREYQLPRLSDRRPLPSGPQGRATSVAGRRRGGSGDSTSAYSRQTKRSPRSLQPFQRFSDIRDYSSFEEVVDEWRNFLNVLFTETPEAVEIIDIQTTSDTPQGEGVGTRFMQMAKAYCDAHHKQLIASRVRNVGFFSQLGFMDYAPQQNDDPKFIYNSKTIPRKPHIGECPTCKGPTKDGYCSQCQWSEHNVNIDSDPLSNPPDPTVDLHRGIQSRVIPSHRWMAAVEDL